MDNEVKMGKIKVLNGAGQLTATGVGSCLIITFYDPGKKIGGMAHAMLPSSAHSVEQDERRADSVEQGERIADSVERIGKDELSAKRCTLYAKESDTRYVNQAIEAMLDEMEKKGAKRQNIEAKLVGGSNMFSAFKSDIGEDNVISAKEKLKKEGVKLVGESVGGSIGRSVEFCVASGLVTVKVKF